MKLFKKFLLGIMMLGLVAFGYFKFMSGKIVSAIGVERMESLIVEEYKDIKNITVDIDLSEVHLEKSDKDYIEIIYPIFDDNNLKINVEHNGDSIVVKMDDKGKLLNFSLPSFNTETIKTTIKIPENYLVENLEVNLAMGDLYAEEVLAQKSILNLEMGTLHVTKANLGVLETQLNMGSTEFKDVEVAGDSSFLIEMGSFEGNLKISNGHVDMKVNMGSIDLDLYDGKYKINSNVDLGDVNIKDKSFQEGDKEMDAEITLEVSMGDILVRE